jgi:hypothetical protein
MGGKASEKTLAHVVDGPVPIHALPRPRYRCSSRHSSLPSLDFPTPPRHNVSCPMSVSVCFQHLFDRAKFARTLPQWFTLLRCRLYKQSAVAITLGTVP